MAKGSRDPDPPTSDQHVTFLVDAMHRKGLNPKAFGKSLGVHENTVRNWLHGTTRPPLGMVNRIATGLDVSSTRLLETFGYAPNLGNILDHNDQLQDENARLTAVKVQVQANIGAGRVGVLADALARTGKYSFRIHPWWRGTGETRLHFADFVVVQRTTTTGAPVSRGMLKEDVLPEYAYVSAWFDGHENWGHLLRDELRPSAADLVITVPRYIATGGATAILTRAFRIRSRWSEATGAARRRRRAPWRTNSTTTTPTPSMSHPPSTRHFRRSSDPLRRQLESELENRLGSGLGDEDGSLYYALNPWDIADTLAFCDCARRFTDLFPSPALDALSAATAELGWWWPMAGAVVLTDRPTVLRQDRLGRLHSDGGPALAYSDGFAMGGQR